MLDEILTKAGTALLRTLCKSPYKEFYPSELARETGISVTHINRMLPLLEEEGIIGSRMSGRHNLYKLNLENLLAEKIFDLFHTERRLQLPLEFRAALEDFSIKLKRNLQNRLVSLVLFGSLAKGLTTKESDIDVIVITDNFLEAKEITKKLFEELSGSYGHLVEDHIYNKKDFDAAYRKGNDLIINALKDGIIIYDDGFCRSYLGKLPTPTKEYIEEILSFAKKNIKEAEKMCSISYESAILPIRSVVRDCCRALLIIKGVVPGSKHELYSQVKMIDIEYARMLRGVNKIYYDYMERAKKVDKEAIIKYLNKSENLLRKTLQIFGGY